MQPLPLETRLDRVAQHIVRARLYLDLWFFFEEQGSRDKIIETMRKYSEFFRLTPHAYFTSYVIYMAGVFDKKRGTISLGHIIREMVGAGHLVGQGAVSMDALMLAAKPIVEKVTILRHEAFAHRSAHISYDDVFKMADVRPLQLRELTELALEIANGLLLARGLPRQYFNESVREDARAMMQALGKKR